MKLDSDTIYHIRAMAAKADTDKERIDILDSGLKLLASTNLSESGSSKKLIVWSGGLDSTFLLLQACRNNEQFETVYFDIQNNSFKANNEKPAREAISDIIEEDLNIRFTDHVVKISSDICCKYFMNAPFRQAFVWFTGLHHSDLRLQQYNKVEMGYVHHDGIWSDIQLYINYYDAVCKVCGREEQYPGFSFPLKYIKKDEIAKTICSWDDKWLNVAYKVMNKIWTCEPVETQRYYQCGTCPSCTAFNNAKETVYKEILRRKINKEQPDLTNFEEYGSIPIDMKYLVERVVQNGDAADILNMLSNQPSEKKEKTNV